jgi:hypothetical protein
MKGTSLRRGAEKGRCPFCNKDYHEIHKGKAIPLQVWTGPEGSMRFRLPYFKTICTRRW